MILSGLSCLRPPPEVGNPNEDDYRSEITGEIICSPTLDASIKEQRNMFKARLLYEKGDLITGDCYQWDEEFIRLCRVAMSTDSLKEMSATEKRTWNEWVNYENESSSSPTTDLCDGQAIGCTIPDGDGNSFAVCSDGTISTNLCVDGVVVAREELMFSLDKVFMDIYNCVPYNQCIGKEGDVCVDGDCDLDVDFPECGLYTVDGGQ